MPAITLTTAPDQSVDTTEGGDRAALRPGDRAIPADVVHSAVGISPALAITTRAAWEHRPGTRTWRAAG